MTELAMATEAEADGALVARGLDGDGAALDTLVARHHEAVYQAAYRVLGDPDRAADAAQDAFVKALRALDTFRGEASFRTWIVRIATNTARSAGRTTTRRREVALEPESERSAMDSPERATVLRSEAERVEAAIQELPEKQRLAVTLRIQQELSYREIARLLDASEGTVRVNYHLGIKKLREWLA